MTAPRMVVGTAGWSIPADTRAAFPDGASLLERYGRALCGVEINSSFYRPHRVSTYARWADSVPAGFRFAVKVPRTVTHERRLVDTAEPLAAFLAECGGLGAALGPLLVQLPPSLAWNESVAHRFFALLRELHDGPVVVEPRHPSWFDQAPDALLRQFAVSGVAADPARVPAAAHPFGATGTVYVRLHGSPVMYRSSYPAEYLAQLATELQAWHARGASVWCIFDNTASGAAMANALAVVHTLSPLGAVGAATVR